MIGADSISSVFSQTISDGMCAVFTAATRLMATIAIRMAVHSWGLHMLRDATSAMERFLFGRTVVRRCAAFSVTV